MLEFGLMSRLKNKFILPQNKPVKIQFAPIGFGQIRIILSIFFLGILLSIIFYILERIISCEKLQKMRLQILTRCKNVVFH